MKISVISGGFDPIHSGHLTYIEEASKFGDKLFVLLNSDSWLQQKKDRFFMPFKERKLILESMKLVDEVFGFKDDKQGSCKNGLLKIRDKYPKAEIVFCNGGDRNKNNIPEMELKDFKFKFSVGGSVKKNSSSWILESWSYPKEERVWGEFFNLFEDNNIKVKELIVRPGKGMSFQRHAKRNEFWIISKGSCNVLHSTESPEEAVERKLNKHDWLFVLKEDWHQIINPNKEDCHILEIQYGEETEESDIERLHYYEG